MEYVATRRLTLAGETVPRGAPITGVTDREMLRMRRLGLVRPAPFDGPAVHIAQKRLRLAGVEYLPGDPVPEDTEGLARMRLLGLVEPRPARQGERKKKRRKRGR